MSATPDEVQVATFLRDYQRVLQIQELLRSKQAAFKLDYGMPDGFRKAVVTDEVIARLLEIRALFHDCELAHAKFDHSEAAITARRGTDVEADPDGASSSEVAGDA